MRRLARLLRRSGELAERAIRELTEQVSQQAPRNTSSHWGPGSSWLGIPNPSLEPAYARYRRPPFGIHAEAREWRNPWTLGFDAPTGFAWDPSPHHHCKITSFFARKGARWAKHNHQKWWSDGRGSHDSWKEGFHSRRSHRSEKLGRDFFIAWHNVAWWNMTTSGRRGAFEQLKAMKNKQHVCPGAFFRWYKQYKFHRFHRMMYGGCSFSGRRFYHHHHHHSRLIKGFRMLLAARLRRHSYIRRFWTPFTTNLHLLAVAAPQQLPAPKLGVRVLAFNGARMFTDLAEQSRDDEHAYAHGSIANMCRASAAESGVMSVQELMASSMLAEARKAIASIVGPYRFKVPRICCRNCRCGSAVNEKQEPPEERELELPMRIESIGMTVAMSAVVEFDLGARITTVEPATNAGVELTEEVVSDLAAAMRSHSSHVEAVTAEIARLAELGELPVSIVDDGRKVRIHFPNCDVEKVAVLLAERDITHGRILEVPTVMTETPPPPSPVSTDLSPITSSGSSWTNALSSIHSSWQEFLADVPPLEHSESTFSSLNGSSLVTIA